MPVQFVPMGKEHEIKKVKADNWEGEDPSVRKLLPVMSDDYRKSLIFKRFSMEKAKKVFLPLLEDLNTKGIDYKVDEQWTSIRFTTGEGRESCMIIVDLHAIEEESCQMFAVVFKKQRGNVQTLKKFFQEWNEKFAWAWNTAEEELYEEQDDDDDEE